MWGNFCQCQSNLLNLAIVYTPTVRTHCIEKLLSSFAFGEESVPRVKGLYLTESFVPLGMTLLFCVHTTLAFLYE